MSDLEIGGVVYRYISAFPSRVFKNEVVSIREYKDKKQYHIRCLSCSDHDDCEMLIAYDDYNDDRFKFIQMLNNDCYEDDQRCWHVTGYSFFKTKEEAIINRLEEALRDGQKELSEMRKKFESNERSKIKYIEGLKFEIEAQEEIQNGK